MRNWRVPIGCLRRVTFDYAANVNPITLSMTPQLQLAIKLISMSNDDVRSTIDEFRVAHPGTLAPLAPGEADPGDVDDEDTDFMWSMSAVASNEETGDILVFGNPPAARANGRAFPRLRTLTDDRDAAWFVRSLRQRARSFEKVVAALVELQPRVAITVDGRDLDAVSPGALRELVGMHESTISRIASACTIRNLHGVVAVSEIVRSARRKR